MSFFKKTKIKLALIGVVVLIGVTAVAVVARPRSRFAPLHERFAESSEFSPNDEVLLLPASRDDMSLYGGWRIVRVEKNGVDVTDDEAKDLCLIFHRGDEVTMKSASHKWDERRYKISLDPNSSTAIDLTPRDEKGPTSAGIYSFSTWSRQLRLCQSETDPAKRPTRLRTSKGDGLRLLVMEQIPQSPGLKEYWNAHAKSHEAEMTFWKRHRDAKSKGDRDEAKKVKATTYEQVAEQCLKIAEKYPDTTAEIAALGWAADNSLETEPGRKACEKLILRIPQTDLDILGRGLCDYAQIRSEKLREIAPVLLERVRRNPNHSQAAKLLKTICLLSYDRECDEPGPSFAEAADLIVAHHADAPEINNFCEILGLFSGSPSWAGQYEKHLRAILCKNRNRSVQVSALFALAMVVQSAGASRQAEAEDLYRRFLDTFDGQTKYHFAGIEQQLIQEAEKNLVEIKSRSFGSVRSGN